MKKLTVVAVLVSLVVAAAPVAAHQWGCWKQPNTTVVTRNNGGLSNLAALAINEWDNETCLSIPTVSYHTEVSVYDGYYGSTGWAGLASIQNYSGCNILHCHAQVNRSYSYSNNGYRGIYCQEIGHCFGLDHSNDGGCMGGGYYYSISSGTGYTVVQHNTNDIANIYGCDASAEIDAPGELKHDLDVEDHGEELDRPLVHAFWHNNPQTLAETIDLSTAIVVARVSAIWDAADIVVPVEGLNENNESRVPNQRIGFEVQRRLFGDVESSFDLFHTGNGEFILEGDPPYEVGQSYVLFLTPREDGTYLVVSPEGRYEVTRDGLVPASERDFAEVLSGAPVRNITSYVADYLGTLSK